MAEKFFLLSLEDYKKYRDRIKAKKGWWWLRTQGCSKDRVAFVGNEGDLCSTGSHVASSGYVCPAMYLKPNALLNLPWTKEGKYIKLGVNNNKPIKWQLLDWESGLCLVKKPMAQRIFDVNVNNYESSEIYMFLKDMENYFSEEELSLIEETII